MKSGFFKTITGATLIIAVIGLVSKGIGFFREVLFASYFGLSKNYELFLVAAVLPITINTIALFLTQNNYIPHYIKLKDSDKSKAKAFFNQNILVYLAVSVSIALILFFLRETFLKVYASDLGIESFEILKSVFLIFLFTIPVNAICSVISAHLYAEKNFILPMVSQLFLNLIIIFLVFMFTAQVGIYSIPIGFLVGMIFQMIILAFFVKKDISFDSHAIPGLLELRVILSAMFLTIAIESISQIHVLADRFFISQVEPGGIAALNYAMTLFTLPISIITVSLSTAIFPSFTESIVRSETEELKNRLKKSLQFIFLLFIPVTIIYLQYGEIIVRIIFQRGNFSSTGTSQTAEVLGVYSISILFYSIYAVTYKLIFSASLLKQLFIIICLAAVLKIVLNLLLVGSYQQNGLALSSSLTFIFLFLLSSLLLDRKLKLGISKLTLKYLFIFGVNGLISFYIASQLSFLLNNSLISVLVQIIFMVAVFFLGSQYMDRTLLTELIGNFKLHRGK